MLSAGERRSFTANTIFRDPSWRKRDAAGSLRISPVDAEGLGVVDGGLVRVTTKRGSVEAAVEVNDVMQPGHVSLPNGLGLDYPGEDGASVVTGAAPNELTASEDRDWIAGTPWHKHVPARARAGRRGLMRRTRFDDWPCPIARTTDLIGDWWTPLVLRELFAGRSRFDDIQAALGCSRAVLAQRLDRLVDEGMLVKVPYEEHPPRFDYRLTDKGRAFWDVLAAMWRWGSDWLWDGDEPPVVLVDRETRAEIRPLVVDEATGDHVDVRQLRMARNPRS